MTAVRPHLSIAELEQGYRTATEPIAKSHFHALWLLSRGYDIDETAEILSFSTRWVRILIKRYNEGGPSQLGDQRANNGTEPTILTPDALGELKERLKTPPDDGGVWTGPKIARWLAQYHGLKSVHDQRGWDALIAIGYSIQQPRPRHPQAASICRPAWRTMPSASSSSSARHRRARRNSSASPTARARALTTGVNAGVILHRRAGAIFPQG
jgi:transposase